MFNILMYSNNVQRISILGDMPFFHGNADIGPILTPFLSISQNNIQIPLFVIL